MARRKSKSFNIMKIPKLTILVIIAIIIITSILLLPSDINPSNISGYISGSINDLFSEEGVINSSVENFVLPNPNQLSLQPIGDTIDCTIRFSMIAVNSAGQTIKSLDSKSSTSPLYVNLALVERGLATTSVNTIKEYQLTPKIKCDNKFTTSGNIGYFLPHPQVLTFSVWVQAPNGGSLSVGNFQTPPFSHGDLGDNVERYLPTVKIPASTIEAKAPVSTSKYNSEVTISMGGELTFNAQAGYGIEYKYFVGQNQVQIANHLITIDKTSGTQVSGNQQITITKLWTYVGGYDLLGLQNKINSLDPDPNKSKVDVGASLFEFRNVKTNEAFPTARILECLDTSCNQNRVISNTVTLTQSTTSKDNFRGFIEVPLGAPAGHYAVEVKSADRSQVASRGFLVENVVVSCSSGYELINGACHKIIVPTCSSTQTGIYPNCVNITCKADEVGTYPNCTSKPIKCEDSGQVGTYPNCSDPETKTEPPTPTTSLQGAKSRIEYVVGYTSTSDLTNRDCTDDGSIPPTGLDLTAFQFVGRVGKCGGNQFTDFELRPVIDFGTINALVDKTSVNIDKKIYVSVNNPFPASPIFDPDTCKITTGDLPTACKINNLPAGTKQGSFTFTNQFTEVKQLRSGTHIYDLALIKMNSGEIDKLIKDLGFTLKDGDEYSIMIQIMSKFDATIGTEKVTGVTSPLVYINSFNYRAYNSDCDLTISMFDDAGQCVAKPRETCPNPTYTYDKATNSCKPPTGGGGGGGDDLICETIPTCNSDQILSATDTKDSCGFYVLECIARTAPPPPPPIVDGCPQGKVPPPFEPFTPSQCVDPKPVTVSPLSNGGCPPEYILNTQTKLCQLIGSGHEDDESGGGGNDDVNLCKLDNNFSLGQCFAQIFNAKGTLQVSGATQSAIIVVVMLMILIIVVAVVIRKRRGKGFKI